MACNSRPRRTNAGAVLLTASLAGALAAGQVSAASRLSLTLTPGTADCGRSGLTLPAVAPFSGELDTDTAGTTKLLDLGLGCLYFGGGKATVFPPARIPDGSASYLDIVGTSLGASAGTGMFDCTRGAGPGQHCLNGSAGTGGGACTKDADCGGAVGSCARDANCYFGAPVPVASPAPSAALSVCLIDVVQNDAGGTIGTTTGTLDVTLPLSARVYLTGNSAAPCPRCTSNVCDPSWKSSTNGVSPDAGASCTPVGSLSTTDQCRPAADSFLGPLPIDLAPLTTGTASETEASGTFCPSQKHPGALGQPTARRIVENGVPGGDLTDGAAHPAVLGSAFCIPRTGNASVDAVADLPGPGAIGLNVSAQLVAGPKVVCVNNTPTVSGPLTVRDACTATEDTLGSFAALKVLLAAISAEDGGKTLRMSGINLQIVNGTGTTTTANGAGNLIVGYNVNGSGQPRSGSHDVIVGDEHGYSSYGGVVAGLHNLIGAPGAVVSGGRDNRALGAYAAVTGGIKNRAAGVGAAVGGGEGNGALGEMSSVTGGAGNSIAATEKAASITGGVNNRIDAKGKAFAASISGGSGNRASARAASVSGGSENEATVLAASVRVVRTTSPAPPEVERYPPPRRPRAERPP